jgi:hypothetical protein
MTKTMLIREAVPIDIDLLVSLLSELFSIERDFTVDALAQTRGLELMIAPGWQQRPIQIFDLSFQPYYELNIVS